MQREPWLNFGLWIGDDEAPDDDNVVVMTADVYWLLSRKTLNDWGTEDVPLNERLKIWQSLGRDGDAPRMRIVVRGDAVQEALDRVMAEEKAPEEPLVVEVQRRLDSYKTTKQRIKRMKALSLLIRDNDGYAEIGWSIELMVLKLRVEHKRIVTADEIQDLLYDMVRRDKGKLSINVDGQRIEVPQEVIDRNPPPHRRR